MSTDRSGISLTDKLAEHVDRFEKMWQTGKAPRLTDCLPDGNDSPALRVMVLNELIKIDLEFRWRSPKEAGLKRRLLEDYLAKHQELQELAKVPLDLIVEEYRVRQRWGDRPAHAEYCGRFSTHGDALVPSLIQVDAELAAEATKNPQPIIAAGQSTAPPEVAAQDSTIDSDNNPVTQDANLPTVSEYDILGVLGRGGMGVVYRARHRKLKRLVALKMIVAGAHAGPQQLARFQAEAEAVAQLQHPNIVQIYEVGGQEGSPFFCLVLVSGGSLDRKLQGTPQDPRAAAKLVRTVARAMQKAHDAGIIHRDLKPANILMAEDGTPKIADFGLAKQFGSALGQTQSGAIMGTPSYMAPEQAAGKTKDTGTAADVYALGAILYEMLTGRPPFKAATPLDTVMQVISEEPVPPIHLQPKTARDLDTICLKCLQKNPKKRYASCEALADDLRRFLKDEPIHARPISRLERTAKWIRRRPATALALSAGGVALVTIAVLGASLYYGGELQQKHDELRGAYQNVEEQRDLAEERRKDANKQRELVEKREEEVKNQRDLAEERRKEANKLREIADASRREAEEQRRQVQRLKYAADMNMAMQAFRTSNLPRMRELLNAYGPAFKEHTTLVGFEWHFLNRLLHHHSLHPANRFPFKEEVTRKHAPFELANKMYAWDTDTSEPRPIYLKIPGMILGHCQDGRRVVVSAAGKDVAEVWDWRDSPPIRRLRFSREKSSGRVSMNSDGSVMVVQSGPTTFTVWDVTAAQELCRLKADRTQTAISPDGRIVAVCGKDGHQIDIFDSKTGKPHRILLTNGSRPLVDILRFCLPGML